jgi:hypothetical protein
MNTGKNGKSRLVFAKQGWLGAFCDWLLQPIMYWLQDTWQEAPQRTHFWNNHKFDRKTFCLNKEFMIKVPRDPNATTRKIWGFIPRFHMPRFGGWSEYVVIAPSDFNGKWYPGWATTDVTGVSRIPIHGPVRALRGRKQTYLFGVTHTGRQIRVMVVGYGRIGDGGRFSELPLR